MANIQDFKITNAEVLSVYVQKQPDVLTGSASENKKVFDDYPSLIRDKFNQAVEAIDGELQNAKAYTDSKDTATNKQISEINATLNGITVASTDEILNLFT